MHIEKIAGPDPGLRDIFLDPSLGNSKHINYTKFCPQFIHAVYGKSIASYFDQYDISFSSSIRTVVDVLLSSNTATRFEISARQLRALPRKQQQLLCRNYKLVVTDLYESGAELGELLLANSSLVFYDAIFLDSGANTSILDYQGRTYLTPDNVRLIHLPMSLYYIVSRFIYKNLVQTANDFTNSILVPCLKPHEHRILLLSKLDKAGLLASSDWSLGYDPSRSAELFKYRRIYDIEYESGEVKDFIDRYRQVLPKFLCDVDSVGDPEIIMEPVHANYRWQIVAETFDDRVDLSEKIFQAFMCMNPALILAGTGYITALRQLGFKMSLDYEDADTEQQIDNIINIINTVQPDMHEAEFNQQLCCDIAYWSEYFAKTLAEAER